MAFVSDHDFKVPINELLYIVPDSRKKIFLRLIQDYKTMIPSLKCICANLCWGVPDNKMKIVDKEETFNQNSMTIPEDTTNKLAYDIDYIRGVKAYESQKDPDFKGLSIDDAFASNTEGKLEIPVFDQPCQVDYYLIFSGISAGREVIFIDLPFVYSKRSIPAYRYCIREHKERDFFVNAIEEMARIPRQKFNEFIEMMAKLSLDKDDPLYWKKPENSDQLMKYLVDLQLRYVKRYK